MAWLGTWAKRIKLDIDYTNDIGASVTQFPLTIHLKAANADTEDVFADLGANSQKIAITKTDGTTQLYAEVEQWDNTNSVGIIHCSKSDWTIDADTSVYLYYDNAQADNTTYIGLTAGSAPATSVWDSNFKMVHHMKDATTSTITDSTGNNNGTKLSANNPQEANEKIGKGQSFSSDYIEIPDSASLEPGDTMTIEFWLNLNSITNGTRQYILGKRNDSSAYASYEVWARYVTGESADKRIEASYVNDASQNKDIRGGVITTGVYSHFCITQDSANGIENIYQNGALLVADDTSPKGTRLQNSEPLRIAYSGFDSYLDGHLDEIRISAGMRTAAWLKASYNSGNDSLLTYNNHENLASGYTTQCIIC